jgi:hypothetical protein
MVLFAIGSAATGRYHPTITPPPTPPSPNGYDDFVAAGKMLEANGGVKAMYGPGLEQRPILAQERIVVARNAAVLARMRIGLSRECWAPVCRGFNKMEPDLANVRNLARLTVAEADVRAADGDLVGATSPTTLPRPSYTYQRIVPAWSSRRYSGPRGPTRYVAFTVPFSSSRTNMLLSST